MDLGLVIMEDAALSPASVSPKNTSQKVTRLLMKNYGEQRLTHLVSSLNMITSL